jgi:hypothetical protein
LGNEKYSRLVEQTDHGDAGEKKLNIENTEFAETTRPAFSAEMILAEDTALHTPLQAGGETLALA